MTHFLSLTCLSYLRSWYLTAPAVLAGAERDGIDYGEEPAVTTTVTVDRATGTITIDESGNPPPAPPPESETEDRGQRTEDRELLTDETSVNYCQQQD